MKGDFSRLRFDPGKNYTSVLQQQGRVSLDADANEQCAIDEYLRKTETVDVIGAVGGPINHEGFRIRVHNGAIDIGKGRYYVEGLLCENPHAVAYTDQPFLIDPTPSDQDLVKSLQQGTISAIQVYLQVWQRLVTALDDDCLREPALGQADTTARLQTVWQVIAKGVASNPNNPTAGATGDCCKSIHTGLVPVKHPGKLLASTSGESGDCSCEPIPAAGYRGLENQLYRVEIHEPGDETIATFKWSRENGSVVVAVTGTSARDVYVDSLGPDANLGFAALQWVEIFDDTNLFSDPPNQPGALYQIQSISPETLSVTMTQPVSWVDPGKNARMRRWDQFGSSAGASGVALSSSALPLENGIEVEFGKGQYVSGDYWLIPARTATGEIDWPPCDSDGNRRQAPHRTDVFLAPLACIHWDGQKQQIRIEDCRKSFPPLTDLTPCKSSTCCKYQVGDGVTSFGDFTLIQDAIDNLPEEGGEVCILPGTYYENVLILEGRDIVVHGCGWQTRVASASSRPTGSTGQPTLNLNTGALNPVAAVFTIVESHHVKLKSFVIEAADDEAGILIDGTATSLSNDRIAKFLQTNRLRGAIDITIEDMVITAATLPAILAERVQLLRVDRNRIATKNIRSRWSAVYASGKEIHIERNRVGIRSAQSESEPSDVFTTSTVNREFIDNSGLDLLTVKVALHPGGIQIGGPSTDVYILENEIEGGSRNGITLGGFEVLDPNGGSTGIWTGTLTTGEPEDCDCSTTLLTPTTWTQTGTTGYKVVAGGLLNNIQIHRNCIRDMGLCGIGPAGFFNLVEALEIITISELNISENEISRTLLRDIEESDANILGYGAICVADVLNLIVRDNTITNFGGEPGAAVSGIYVLHGEMIEISRNQVIEARDWTRTTDEQRAAAPNAARGGIFIFMVTPPTFSQPLNTSLWGYDEAGRSFSAPVYEPTLPALRIENNTVRVPVSYGLFAAGLGPFAIANNHIGCGGLVPVKGTSIAQTVCILNLGTAIENAKASNLPSNVYYNSKNADTSIVSADFQNVSSGSVLFNGNMCQLEGTASRQREICSVFIFTADHLIFSSNHCWLDTSRVSALSDALLIGGSLNVVGNRFQESPLSVFVLSAITAGLINITGQNISTFCILVLGLLTRDNNNINLLALNPNATTYCTDLERVFNDLFTRQAG